MTARDIPSLVPSWLVPVSTKIGPLLPKRASPDAIETAPVLVF